LQPESIEAYDKPADKSDLKMIHKFHSYRYSSDKSKQDAATTHAHMSVLFDQNWDKLGDYRPYFLTTWIGVQSIIAVEQLYFY
jgi:hypothetical protein